MPAATVFPNCSRLLQGCTKVAMKLIHSGPPLPSRFVTTGPLGPVFDFESYQDAYDAWQERLEAGYLKLGECIIAYRRCVAKGSGRVVRRLVTTGRAGRSPR